MKTEMTRDELLQIMSGVRTLQDCKQAWELRANWLCEHPGDEVVIEESEALWMHEQALQNMEAQKQAERAA